MGIFASLLPCRMRWSNNPCEIRLTDLTPDFSFQAAYILYPPHGKSWDPCSEMPHEEMRHSMTDDGRLK